MNSLYRDEDYRAYAGSNFYRRIIYGGLNSYRNANYGSYALAFYFPGFVTGMGLAFKPTPQDVVNKLNSHTSGKKYIRGHIINSFLDGPLDKENLVPLTYSANRQHDTVEERIKAILSGMKSRGMTADEAVLGYEVDVLVSDDNIPEGINIALDFFYLSDVTGELHTAAHKREAASDKLLRSWWNWEFPLSIRILN